MHTIRRPNGWVLFISLALMVCCILPVVCVMINTIAFDAVGHHIERTLKIGMSRDEVYRVFAQIGVYTVDPVYSGTCGSNDDRTDYDVKHIIVRGQWNIIQAVGTYVCFDERGNLAGFRVAWDW